MGIFIWGQIMKRKGYTITELLSVLSIVAIIGSASLPAYNGLKQEAQVYKAQKEAQTLKAAVESYYTKNRSQNPVIKRSQPSTHQKMIQKSKEIMKAYSHKQNKIVLHKITFSQFHLYHPYQQRKHNL